MSEDVSPPFPAFLLPNPWDELVTAVSQSLPVPLDYAACAMLGVASAAMVGRVEVQPKTGHREAIQLYLCLGGESGTNKSAAMRIFAEPLHDWLGIEASVVRKRNHDREVERERLKEKLKDSAIEREEAWEINEKIDQLEDEPEIERILSDTTPEALARCMKRQGGKAILYTDEGGFINVLAGNTYGKGGMANIDTVLKGFDNGSVHIIRVAADPIDLPRTSLSVTVGMQPAMLARLTANEDLTDRGFPQRLLYFIPENNIQVKIEHLPTVPADLLAQWSKLIGQLSSLHRGQPGVMTISMEEDAAEVLYGYRATLNERLTSDLGGNAAIRAWIRKAHGKTARLAALLQLMDNPESKEVDLVHLNLAVALMEGYFIPHATKALGGGEKLSMDAKNLLDTLIVMQKNGETLTTSTAWQRVRRQKRFRGATGKALFEAIFADLSNGNYVKLIDQNRGDSRNRAKIIEIHPDLLFQVASTGSP